MAGPTAISWWPIALIPPILLTSRPSTSDPGYVIPSSLPSAAPSTYGPPTPAPAYTPPASVVIAPTSEMPVDLPKDMLDKLSRLPSLWPKTVKLRMSWTFTLIFQGKEAGNFDVAAGTTVNLLKVKGAKLLVSYQEGQAEIPANYTNIGNRVSAQAILDAPMPPSDPVPTATSTNDLSAASASGDGAPSSPPTQASSTPASP